MGSVRRSLPRGAVTGCWSGAVRDRLDVVAIGVVREPAVVAGVVVRSRTGRSVVGAPGAETSDQSPRKKEAVASTLYQASCGSSKLSPTPRRDPQRVAARKGREGHQADRRRPLAWLLA